MTTRLPPWMGGPPQKAEAWRDPVRQEVMQVLGESGQQQRASGPVEWASQGGGIRFLAVGRVSKGALNRTGRDAIVLVATYAQDAQEAERCRQAVRMLCEAPATMHAMGSQPRLSVADEAVGTISLECDGASALVHIVVTAGSYPQAMGFKCLGELQAQCAAHFAGRDAALAAAQASREEELSEALRPLMVAVSAAFSSPADVYDAEQAHLPFADLYFARPTPQHTKEAPRPASPGRARPGSPGGGNAGPPARLSTPPSRK